MSDLLSNMGLRPHHNPPRAIVAASDSGSALGAGVDGRHLSVEVAAQQPSSEAEAILNLTVHFRVEVIR